MTKEKYDDVRYMRKESPVELSTRKVWTGVYRGIPFEVNSFSTYKNNEGWSYYLKINIDSQLPKDIADKFWLEPKMDMLDKRVTYDYMTTSIADLDWHCGITFYEKISGFELNQPRYIKAGCDFQHIWDDHKFYDLGSITFEVHGCIDSLWKMCDDKIKIWSRGDGKFRFENEYIKHKD